MESPNSTRHCLNWPKIVTVWFTWCWEARSDPSSSYRHPTLWADTCTSQTPLLVLECHRRQDHRLWFSSKNQRKRKEAKMMNDENCKSERDTFFLKTHCDSHVLFFQFFNVFGLLLERRSLLLFHSFGDQDVVIRQWSVLRDKQDRPKSDFHTFYWSIFIYKSRAGWHSPTVDTWNHLTTGGNEVCSLPFSLTTPINSSSSILGWTTKWNNNVKNINCTRRNPPHNARKCIHHDQRL